MNKIIKFSKKKIFLFFLIFIIFTFLAILTVNNNIIEKFSFSFNIKFLDDLDIDISKLLFGVSLDTNFNNIGTPIKADESKNVTFNIRRPSEPFYIFITSSEQGDIDKLKQLEYSLDDNTEIATIYPFENSVRLFISNPDTNTVRLRSV